MNPIQLIPKRQKKSKNQTCFPKQNRNIFTVPPMTRHDTSRHCQIRLHVPQKKKKNCEDPERV
jgi:hypothetical protein